MRAIAIVALSSALAGCGLQADYQQPRRLSLPSKKCTAVAQQRMLDAAEDGYEADLQKSGFRWSLCRLCAVGRSTCRKLAARYSPRSNCISADDWEFA